MSALVTSEIFRLFLNTLTPDDKYSLRHKQIFWQQLSNDFISKKKDFMWISYCISKMCGKFRTFWKKKKSILA